MRAGLASFELVPRSLAHWHPSRPGEWRRIPGDAAAWADAARAGDDVELIVEPYSLVPVRIDASSLRTPSAQVWIRRAADDFTGIAPRLSASRAITVAVERGVAHEIWVEPYVDGPRSAPWGRGVAPVWTGTPTGPTEISAEAAPRRR